MQLVWPGRAAVIPLLCMGELFSSGSGGTDLRGDRHGQREREECGLVTCHADMVVLLSCSALTWREADKLTHLSRTTCGGHGFGGPPRSAGA